MLPPQVLDDSEDDWDSGARGKGSGKKPTAKKQRAAAESSEGEEEDDDEEDDLEAFDDGYASDLMGDDEDRWASRPLAVFWQRGAQGRGTLMQWSMQAAL